MAAPSASSSGWTYEVFLNFRGEDTRKTFTGHLYNGLDGAKIRTFIDSENLHTGENIGEELLSAIQQSRISIPIFSKNYASSKWCLKELVKIVECSKTMNQLVLPIFYDVDPSDVRYSTGTYAEAFEKQGKRFDQKIINEWKDALREVGELNGWDLKNIANGHEGALVREVVAEVSRKLTKDSQIVSHDDLVGIQSRVEEMMSLLNIESEDKDVKIVGVWGLGGIGKTTITKFVYNTISHYFEGCSFLENVREISQHYRGLIDLQNQLVTDLLGGESIKITNVEKGINVISERFHRMKVLIVLDDVDENLQLDAFIKKRDCFGVGSRIIITTRYARILSNAKVDKIYEHIEMDPNDSLQLFTKHAFGSEQTPADFLNLSKKIVRITGGLPLALKVIGSSLFEVSISEWQETLEKLHEFPNDEVQKKLRISYDGLTYLQKQIFLDIACFCIGMDKNIACFIWKKCNFFPESEIKVLCQKSLIKIGENNEIKMHDQLKDLGKEIVRQENLHVPGERSRLCSHKEALEVLEKHTGTDKVEGLSIDFGDNSIGKSCLTSEGFAEMKRLRLLQVDYAQFVPGFRPSFSELKWLRWKGCPSEFMLTEFNPVNLVVLDLSYSLVGIDWIGWDYIKVAKNLKVLNLSGCKRLSKIPKLGNPWLEVLILENCIKLDDIDESISFLERLVTLNMRGCKKLKALPHEIWHLTCLKNLNLHQCEILDKLPDSIVTLVNLETLDASFCYIEDGGIPVIYLYSLKILRLGGNDFHSLPVEVSSLSFLQTLDLRFCDKLESLPELPSSLKHLNVLRCRSLKSLPRLSSLTNLEELCLADCENLVEMPALLGLRNLLSINLDNCHKLTEIGSLVGLDSLKLFTMKDCRSLRKIGKMSNLRKLKELRFTDFPVLHEIEGLEGLDSLELFTMLNCEPLRKIGKMSNLRKLKELRFTDFPVLHEIEGLEGLDSLELFTMQNCEPLRKIGKMSNLRKLKELRFTGFPELGEIEGLEGLDSLELFTMQHCESLRKIGKMSNLRKLKELRFTDFPMLYEIEGLEGLDSLELFTMQNCGCLEKIGKFSNLRKLKELRFIDLPQLFKIEGLEGLDSLELFIIQNCGSLWKIGKMSNLRKLKELRFTDFPMLDEIEGLEGLDSLELFTMQNCRSLEKIGKMSNLRKLKELRFTDFPILREIEGFKGLDSLELLAIRQCHSLLNMPELSDLKKLVELEVEGCWRLLEIEGFVGLDSLALLTIRWCPSLRKIPRLSELEKLSVLEVEDCEDLLEIEGSVGLNSLVWLTIRRCISLIKIPKLSDLEILRVLKVEGYKGLLDIEGLVSLDSLKLLIVESDESWDSSDFENLSVSAPFYEEDLRMMDRIRWMRWPGRCLWRRAMVNMVKLEDLCDIMAPSQDNCHRMKPNMVKLEDLDDILGSREVECHEREYDNLQFMDGRDSITAPLQLYCRRRRSIPRISWLTWILCCFGGAAFFHHFEC